MTCRERKSLLPNTMLTRAFTLMALVLWIALGRPAWAQDGSGLIRDAEIESTIRGWITPVFRAAGLDPSFVQIYLVNDPQINSFVAGGQRIFINTGLLMRSQTPNQVIGVLAHETGHIAGGHLLRMQDALSNATAEAIAGFLLGGAAAVLGRDGSAVAAGAAAGDSVAERELFAYSINQEARADQAALGFLDDTHQSARGLLEFFQILEKEEVLLPGNQDPYLRTHPLTTDRIDYVAHHVETSPYSDAKDSPVWIDQHARLVAKLKGFLEPTDQVFADYPPSDHSIYARYARAAAYHRLPQDDKALAEMDSLLKDEPDNPYFWELRGQILFEGGHAAASVPDYQKSVTLKPDAPLLRTELATALLESSEDLATARIAEAQAEAAVRMDDSDPDAWHALGLAQGRLGKIGNASLDLAEEATIAGDRETAGQESSIALKKLPRGSPDWLRADDLRRTLKLDND
jgi:predicted Zn-dependent protease